MVRIQQFQYQFFENSFLRIFVFSKAEEIWPEAKHSTFYFYEALGIISTLFGAFINLDKVCVDILCYKDIWWNSHIKQLKLLISLNTHCIIAVIIYNFHSVSTAYSLV